MNHPGEVALVSALTPDRNQANLLKPNKTEASDV